MGKKIRDDAMALQAQRTQRDAAQPLWTFRSHRDGRMLRARKPPLLLHPGVRHLLHPGLDLRLPPGRLALRPGRSNLVGDRRPPLVAGPYSSPHLAGVRPFGHFLNFDRDQILKLLEKAWGFNPAKSSMNRKGFSPATT